jgi:nitric oxide reductase NorE protein
VTTLREAPSPTKREGHIPGEPGLWIMLLGDMVVFAVFFGTILVLRGRHPELILSSQPALHQGLGVTNTLVLLTSSLLVANGVRLARARDARAPRLFLGALACAVVFAGIKAIEYTDLGTNGHSPGTNDFFTYYFVFTGIHLGHVVLGSVGLIVASRLARSTHTGRNRDSWLEGIACFWHLVDLLWIVLFALLYLVH